MNPIFYRNGGAPAIDYDMRNRLTNRWTGNACGSTLYAYIDNRPHGGAVGYCSQSYQLAYTDGGCLAQTRYHIRLFNGGYDTHGQYGYWSIAGVHHECWNGYTHQVDSWEGAESFVKNDFAGKWFVGQIQYYGIGNAGWDRVWNDGWTPHIELIA